MANERLGQSIRITPSKSVTPATIIKLQKERDNKKQEQMGRRYQGFDIESPAFFPVLLAPPTKPLPQPPKPEPTPEEKTNQKRYRGFSI